MTNDGGKIDKGKFAHIHVSPLPPRRTKREWDQLYQIKLMHLGAVNKSMMGKRWK